MFWARGVLVLAIALSACGGADASSAQCQLPPQEPVPAPPQPPADVARAISFDIDRVEASDRSRGASYRDWPALPKAALETVRAAIPQLELAPDTTIEVNWIANDSRRGTETIVTETVPRAPWPTFPAPPALEEVRAIDFCKKQAAAIERNNAKVRAHAEAIANLLADWRAKQDAVRAQAIARILSTIDTAHLMRDTMKTDIVGVLWKGANLARQVEASTSVIFIFSDMTGPAEPMPDLHTITVQVALYDRRDAKDRDGGEADWTQRMHDRGARVLPFLSWDATTVRAIVARLKEAK